MTDPADAVATVAESVADLLNKIKTASTSEEVNAAARGLSKMVETDGIIMLNITRSLIRLKLPQRTKSQDSSEKEL